MPHRQPLWKVKVNEFEFDLTHDELSNTNLIRLSPNVYHSVNDNRSVLVQIAEEQIHGKKFKVTVAGDVFCVEIKDELDLLLDTLGFSKTIQKKITEIKAPMPGLVLEVSVQEGQSVKEAERLLILSAMKMENSIVIHTDATIKKINVKPGQAVDKGQVLIELE